MQGMTEYPVGQPSMLELAFKEVQHKEAAVEELKQTQAVILEMARGRLFFFAALGLAITVLNVIMSFYLSSEPPVLFFTVLSMLTGFVGALYGFIQFRVARDIYEEKINIEKRALATRISRFQDLREMFYSGRGSSGDWDTM